MIRISNMQWTNSAFAYHNDLINILNNKLKSFKMRYNMQWVGGSKSIEFHPLKDASSKHQRLFLSEVENKTMLGADSPKIKELGRNYLITHRVTKKQYDGFFHTLEQVFDELGLMAEITYSIPFTKETLVLRKGLEKFPQNYPQVKSFPIEK